MVFKCAHVLCVCIGVHVFTWLRVHANAGGGQGQPQIILFLRTTHLGVCVYARAHVWCVLHVCTYLWRCTWVHGHAEDIGWCQMTFSITLHIFFWSSIFHWTWSSLTDNSLARLVDQWAPGIPLSLPLQPLDFTCRVPMLSLSPGCWGSKFRSLSLLSKLLTD